RDRNACPLIPAAVQALPDKQQKNIATCLLRVVKDDAERVSTPGQDTAYTMAQGHAIGAALALRRPMADGEDHDVTLGERHHLALGLRPRPLLDQEKLAARELASRCAQQYRHLQREDAFAIEILMQAVVATRLVLEDERRRTRLTGRMAVAQIG